MVILILIVLGLCLGSFVNAFVWRHYRQLELSEQIDELKNKKRKTSEIEALQDARTKLSISRGRSMCTHCKHPLAAKDLIPVFSYLWLRGKCRYCGKRIEDSPLAELLTPVLFVVSYIFWPLELQGDGLFTFVLWLVFLVGFVALILYDLRWFLLPHSIVLPLIVLAALQALASWLVFDGSFKNLLGAGIGALIIGGLFYTIFVLSKEKWIGGGDITLGVLLGLLVGGPANAFLLIFTASLLGTLIAVPLLVTGKATRSTHLPFGPFLMLAAVVVVLFGEQIIDWYTGSFIM